MSELEIFINIANEKLKFIFLDEEHIWQYSRLTFNRYKIEQLKQDQYFTLVIVPPGDRFRITRSEFEKAASGLVNSYSYQELGSYNCKNIPDWIKKYKIN
jgi:hypothetical protein